MSPLDIVSSLAALGDNQSPPRQWEVGVLDQRLLYFRPSGDAAQTYYVDAEDLTIERTIDALVNRANAVYQDQNGRALRTAATSDSFSIGRYGLTRQDVVAARTTSSTQAGVQQAAFLADRKDPIPRSRIRFSRLYAASGAQVPLWWLRGGYTVIVRNLPPDLSASVDRIRVFRVNHTEYHATDNTIIADPESPILSLEWLLVRQAADIVDIRQAQNQLQA
jgi:hypothetical protein